MGTRECSSAYVRFIGHTPGSLWEVWECPICKYRAYLTNYLTDEQPMSVIAAKLHDIKAKGEQYEHQSSKKKS
jgi:hypothetical protein